MSLFTEKAQGITIQKRSPFSKKEFVVYNILVICGIIAIVNYGLWWFNFSHVSVNHISIYSINLFLFALLSFVIWFGLFQRLGIWFIMYFMKKPVYIAPEKGLKIAMLTCFVPGKEPYQLLENTLSSMVAVTYPHDSWVLDEGNDPVVIEMCKRLGVKHFTRKGSRRFNLLKGQFKAKTKAGNHNSWRKKHEQDYDFVAQMDMDHVPHKDYLDRILGYFKDEKVAFVVAPQIYANTENWIARGAAEQAYIFHGPLQAGFYGQDMPLFIGTNHAYRPKAMQEVGGYSSTIVEDHLTGMRFFANKWKGVYVPEVIAEGEGPGNWVEYLNQQMRWSYGIYEILFLHTPRHLYKLTMPQRINFLVAQSYYFTGVVSVVSIFLTSLYLIFGYSSGSFELLPWVYHAFPPFAIALIIQFWSQRFYLDPKTEKGLGLKGMILALGALPIYALAFFYLVSGKKLQYLVTAKGADTSKNTVPLKTFMPHIVIIGVSAFGFIFSFFNHHDAIQLRFWAIFIVALFLLVILSSRKLTFKLTSFKMRVFDNVLPKFI